MRICFKFEEEDEKKDTDAMKKERFNAIMGMMQVTFYLNIAKGTTDPRVEFILPE